MFLLKSWFAWSWLVKGTKLMNGTFDTIASIFLFHSSCELFFFCSNFCCVVKAESGFGLVLLFSVFEELGWLLVLLLLLFLFVSTTTELISLFPGTSYTSCDPSFPFIKKSRKHLALSMLIFLSVVLKKFSKAFSR